MIGRLCYGLLCALLTGLAAVRLGPRAGLATALMLAAVTGSLTWLRAGSRFGVPGAALVAWGPAGSAVLAAFVAGQPVILLAAPPLLALGLLLAVGRVAAERLPPDRPGRAMLLWLLVGALGGAWLLGLPAGVRGSRDRPAAVRAAPLAIPEQRTLDAGNCFLPPGTYDDLEIRFRLRPGPAATLEVRTRVADPARADGLAALIGTEPRLKIGFVRQFSGRFDPVGRRSDSLRFVRGGSDPAFSATEHAVRIRIQAGRFQLAVDGRELASAHDLGFGPGSLVLLAARGRLQIREFELDPLEPDPGTDPVAGVWCALLPALALLLAGGLTSRVLAASFCQGLELAGWSGLALPAGLLVLPSGTTVGWLVGLELLLAAALLLLLPLRAGSPRVRPVSALLLCLLAPCTCWALLATAGVPRAAAPVNLFSWDGRRLEEPLLYLELPVFRAGNGYLARHRFRSGPVPLEHPDLQRIVLLGLERGPAAWLRTGLAGGGDSGPFEVLDAGFESASLPALRRFTREVLLEFTPDLVLLRVSPELLLPWSGEESERYLSRITAPGFRRTLFDRLRESADPGPAPPPAPRLERELAAFCELLSAAGVDLLLIPRPPRADDPDAWLAGVRVVADAFGCALVRGRPGASRDARRQLARELQNAVRRALAARASGRK